MEAATSLPLSLTLLLTSTTHREMADTEKQRGSKAVLAPRTAERQRETTEETLAATTPWDDLKTERETETEAERGKPLTSIDRRRAVTCRWTLEIRPETERALLQLGST